MTDGPAVILYDAAGKALAVQGGVAIPAATPGLLATGADAAGIARTLRTLTDGTSAVDPKRYPTFAVSATAVGFALNKSMVAVQNDSASSIVRLVAAFARNVQTTAITGVQWFLELRRITGLSAGTALTLQSEDSTDALPSGIIAATGGTVAGESANLHERWLLSNDEWVAGTLDGEAMASVMANLTPIYSARSPSAKPLTVRAGEGFTFKCATSTVVGTYDFFLILEVE